MTRRMESDLEVETAAMHRLEPINIMTDRGDSDIQKFYENSVIFMTGGTGFIGKHLIEKLFRSCNIKKLYILVREKKNKKREQRLADVLNDMLFEDLYKKKPNFADRIETVSGDISEVGLAMSESDRRIVTAEIDIIIHVAAEVNFNATLQKATIINVRGTREMLELARECRKLRAFVHVSTAYTHATYSRSGKEVLDDFYPSPVTPASLIELAEADDGVIDCIAPRLIEDWPNTYTFTKAVTEELLRVTADGVPFCVVRPSTVINAYTEPRPGWVDKSSLNGPTGLCLGIKTGFLHQIPARTDIRIDNIPVDYVSNAVIAAGWETAARNAAGHNDIKIYTVSSTRNRLTWGEASKVLYNNENGVSSQALWYSFAMNVENMYLHTALHWLLHLIPGYIVDGLRMTLGRKARYIKLYTKIHKLSKVLHYFSTNDWLFRDRNTLDLYQKMSPADQVIFNFDALAVDWREMMRLWPIGLRRFILKDGLENQKYARKKQFWLRVSTYLIFGVFLYIFWIVLSYMFLSFTW